MTRRHDFKVHVRARMGRTGERYSVARAHVLVARQEQHAAPTSLPIRPFASVHSVGGQQADVAAARNLLSNAGVTGPDGGPITEAMTFGLAGGIGFLYGVFEYDGTPTMTIVVRNSSMPDPFLESLFERAGAEIRISTTGSKNKARRELDLLLDAETPALCTVGAGRLEYLGLPSDESAMSPHVVGVIGRKGETLLLDDRAPGPLAVGAEAFAAARGAYRAGKHRMISVAALQEDHAWPSALTSAIQAGARGYDRPPVPQFASNVGTAGLVKWHRLLTTPTEKRSWERVFTEGSRAAIGLSRLYDCVTHAYTAPGAGRFLYSDFLTEAGAVIGTESTSEAAVSFRRSGELWLDLAAIACSASDGLTRYAELADLRSAQLDDEPVAEEMAELHAEQRALVAGCTITASEAAATFRQLGEILSQIIEMEQVVVRRLSEPILN